MLSRQSWKGIKGNHSTNNLVCRILAKDGMALATFKHLFRYLINVDLIFKTVDYLTALFEMNRSYDCPTLLKNQAVVYPNMDLDACF